MNLHKFQCQPVKVTEILDKVESYLNGRARISGI